MKNPLLSLLALATIVSPCLGGDTALTIYNQNFAVVRELVPLDLKAGENAASFSGVTAQVEGDSVILRDPAGQNVFSILEQSYRREVVSQPLLLSFYEGKTIEFVQNEPQKPDRVVMGKVIRSGYVPGGQSVEPIIEVDGKVQFYLPGRPRFPDLGDDNILQPMLSWKLRSPAPAKFDAELAYLTNGLSWQASYNIVAPEKGELVDLVGWITVDNNSGTSFKDASLKLLAGDVHKIQPPETLGRGRMASAMLMDAAPQEQVTEKSFDEFHLYTVPGKVTLRDKETKQVEFVRATGVKATRFYVYDGAVLPGWQVGMSLGGDPGYGGEGKKKVAVYREFKNTKENQLGIALPAGKVRFYAQDNADRSLQFVGENTIDHTPKDELVRLYVGDSFDLVGERKQTNFRVNQSNHEADEWFEIKLRNRKTEPVEIRVVEHLYRFTNWQVTEKSNDFKKSDAQTIEFRVALQPDEEKVVTYHVHYTW